MFAPAIRLPNIPGAPQNPSEWEAAFLDTIEGSFGERNTPWFSVTRDRIIPVLEPAPLRVVVPPLPVVNVGWEYVYPEPPAVIRPILPGPVAVRDAPVPRATVVVAGLPTEVERHPEGDFPAGSIFAPGRTWGSDDLDARIPEQQEDDLSFHSGLLDWGIETLLGQQPWQTFGQPAGPLAANTFVASPYVASTPIPSGRAALPPSAAGASMTNGENCGNRRYVTLDRETGKISCKRRRRRRLLTNRDLADLASLKTITGGGAALNAAVIRAVR